MNDKAGKARQPQAYTTTLTDDERQSLKRAEQKAKNNDYTGASLEYYWLIWGVERRLKEGARTDLVVLRLRGHRGDLLCDERRLPENANYEIKAKAFREAEEYLRETLKRWEERKELDEITQKGIAYTRLELAQCLVRQIYNLTADSDESGMEVLHLGTGAIQYFEDNGFIKEDNLRRNVRRLKVLASVISDLPASLEVELFYRKVLSVVRQSNATELHKEECFFQHELAKALYGQRKYGEAALENQEILSRYPEDVLQSDQDAYQAYVAELRWSRLYKGFTVVWVVARMTRLLRIRRTQQRWRKLLFKVSAVANMNLLMRHINRRKTRSRIRWKVALWTARFAARLTIKRRQAAARQRFQKVLLHIRLQIRFIARVKRRMEAKHLTVTRWHQAIAAVKAVSRFNIILKTRQCRFRWQKALVFARLIVAAEKQRVAVKASQRKARARWLTAYRRIRAALATHRKLQAVMLASKILSESPAAESLTVANIGDDSLHTQPTASLSVPNEDIPLDELGDLASTSSGVFYSADASEKSSASDKWLMSYIKFCHWLAKNSPNSSVRSPVKVAILDTGIDAGNAYIRTKWPPSISAGDGNVSQRYYTDFVNTTSGPDDNDGHGTHIAGLMLRFAPNAHLYVARIANTRTQFVNDTQFSSKVRDALNHAINVWDVDIISISFGFRENFKNSIDDLIDLAYGKGKIIFAAACNDGGRDLVSYPANHELVISIRALDGNGREASFNPFATRNDPNFCMLGTNILSTWPTKLGPSPESTTHRGIKERPISRVQCMTNFMDGTSFATPLTAALIANIYSYYREHGPKIFPSEPRPKLEGFQTVKKVLKAMSEERGEHLLLSPWKEPNIFCGYNEDGINWQLKHALVRRTR